MKNKNILFKIPGFEEIDPNWGKLIEKSDVEGADTNYKNRRIGRVAIFNKNSKM